MSRSESRALEVAATEMIEGRKRKRPDNLSWYRPMLAECRRDLDEWSIFPLRSQRRHYGKSYTVRGKA